MVALTVGLWHTTPGSLVPDEDQGYYIGAVFLPDGATLERTDKVVNEVVDGDQVEPGQRNADRLHRPRFPRRRLPQQRGDHLRHPETLGRTPGLGTQQLVGEFFMKTAHIKEGLVLAFAPPPIFGLGNAGGFEFYIQNRGEGGAAATGRRQWASSSPPPTRIRCSPACRRCGAPTCRNCTWTSTAKKPRRWACRSTRLFGTLSATLGYYYVNDFNKFGRTWQVLMSAEPGYRKRPD